MNFLTKERRVATVETDSPLRSYYLVVRKDEVPDEDIYLQFWAEDYAHLMEQLGDSLGESTQIVKSVLTPLDFPGDENDIILTLRAHLLQDFEVDQVVYWSSPESSLRDLYRVTSTNDQAITLSTLNKKVTKTYVADINDVFCYTEDGVE